MGQFRNENIAQTFRVTYRPDGGQQTEKDFIFKKIKSLFHGACTNIGVTSNVTAAPCQIVNIPIAFNNIQWATNGEPASSACFGSITTYEYLLPANWSVNGVTSTGSNWIQGSNSVVVTSDLGTGGEIRIRPANNCGSGLANNSIHSVISINRPRPTINFSGNSTICTANTFTSSNIPSWVTDYTWSLNPSSLGTISGTNPVTITKQNVGFAQLSLTLGAPGCPNYSYSMSEILPGVSELVFGTPIPAEYAIYGYDPNDGNRFGRLTMTVSPVGIGATYKFYVNNVLRQTTSSNSWSFIPQDCDVEYEFTCIVQNACGQAAHPVGHTVFFPCVNYFRVSNTINSNSVIVETTSPKRSIAEIKVFDRAGNLKMVKRYQKQTKVQLDISTLPKDVYVLIVTDGKASKSFSITK